MNKLIHPLTFTALSKKLFIEKYLPKESCASAPLAASTVAMPGLDGCGPMACAPHGLPGGVRTVLKPVGLGSM